MHFVVMYDDFVFNNQGVHTRSEKSGNNIFIRFTNVPEMGIPLTNSTEPKKDEFNFGIFI